MVVSSGIYKAALAWTIALFVYAAPLSASSITVVTDENYPPYIFKDPGGNPVGLLIDLWKLWEQNTGIQVDLVSLPWALAQEQVLEGKADVIEMIFRTPERESLYSFSEPYETVQTNIYTLKGITGVSSAPDLAGFVVGAQEGDACVSTLQRLGVHSLRLYSGYRQMIDDMLADNIKIVCMDEQPASYYIYLLDNKSQIRSAFTLYTAQFHRAVRKNETTILDLVNRGMATITDEQLDVLRKKWTGQVVHEHVLPSYLGYAALIALLLAAVLALWIRLLKVAVKKKTAELRDQSEQIEQERTRLQEIIDATRAGTWEWNVQTNTCVVNDRWAQMLGYQLHELTPVTLEVWKQLIHPDDKLLTSEDLDRHLKGETAYYEADFRMRHKTGQWVWIAGRGKLISRTSDGAPLMIRGTNLDITERKLADAAIWRQAHYDHLTQLPNRRLFNERLSELLTLALESHSQFALLTIDIDRFKEVNDTLGHPAGDELIIQAAQRIRRSVPDANLIARFGGDEFSVLITDQKNIGRLSRVASELLDQLARPYQLAAEQVFSSASIGISVYPDDAKDGVELQRHADQAMYAAKNNGRNGFSFFTSSMQEAALHRMQLIRDLRLAIVNNQFEDHYQPIVELATGRIYKAEALLRWRHPTKGFISPAEFIPLAEEIGVITQIGDWIFSRAVANIKKWLLIVGPDLQISVNKSPVQFKDTGSGQLDWLHHLNSSKVPGKHLVIEITEGLLLRHEPVIEDKLEHFRKSGIQIALDDFGTGYSSLSYLTKFDINYLKIDQSFTRELAQGRQSPVLCEAIIMMAHSLGLKVIAEGVETAQQRELLLQMGCDYAQGYLYSRPIPAAKFEAFLQEHYRTEQASQGLLAQAGASPQ